jgi:hypothetical protein
MQTTRRSYSKLFKAQVIQECAQPGALIASIALSSSFNANLPTNGFAYKRRKARCCNLHLLHYPCRWPQQMRMQRHQRSALKYSTRAAPSQ